MLLCWRCSSHSAEHLQYAAASLINGKQIKPNSIPKNRLTKKAVKQLHGAKGAQGLPGQRGTTPARRESRASRA